MYITIDYNDFKIIQYHDYTIRYIDTICKYRMYLISEIVEQFTSINNTKKQMYDYIRLTSTKELLDVLYKNSQTWNSRFVDKYQKDFKNITFNKNYKNLPEIIHLIKIKGKYGSSPLRYIVNEIVLNDCLMWLDKDFAIKIILFIIQCRNIDNNCLKEQIEGLVYKVNDLNTQLMLVTKTSVNYYIDM